MTEILAMPQTVRETSPCFNREVADVDLVSAQERIAVIVARLAAEHPSVPGIAVVVRHRDGETTSVVRGLADPASGQALTIDHAHRIASCTKTFVAATVVSLVNDGLVALDEPVIDQLPPDVADVFTRFEHGDVVTLRQLLQHRSGLVDHTNFPEFGEAIASEWTPLRQLGIAVAHPALFAPGDAFSYSDSGYVLLGQMIEHLTGTSLAAAVRERAGLDATTMPSLHWEVFEPTPAGLSRAHQLLEGNDTHDWSPTFDLFGGGGLVSTMPDLCRWWSSWFARQHGTVDVHLDRLASTAMPDGTSFPGGDRLGLGVFRREVAGRRVWAHAGFWGLETGHVPDLGVSYALSITHRAAGIPSPVSVATEIIAAL